MKTIIIKLGNNKGVSKSQLLKVYKQLCFMAMCHESIIKDPERFYNYCIETLNILGFAQVKQNNITYDIAVKEIYNTIGIIENYL